MKTVRIVLIAFILGLAAIIYSQYPISITPNSVNPMTNPTNSAANSTNSIPRSTSTDLALKIPTTCTVTTGIIDGDLNIRSGPGIEYSVLRTVEEENELEYLGKSDNGWINIRLDNIEGWVSAEFASCE